MADCFELLLPVQQTIQRSKVKLIHSHSHIRQLLSSTSVKAELIEEKYDHTTELCYLAMLFHVTFVFTLTTPRLRSQVRHSPTTLPIQSSSKLPENPQDCCLHHRR